MSSRALRRAQRERDEDLARAQLAQDEASTAEEGEGGGAPAPTQSMYAMLNEDEEPEEEHDDEHSDPGLVVEKPDPPPVPEQQTQTGSKKKKKKKQKSKKPKDSLSKDEVTSNLQAQQIDELDRTLQALASTKLGNNTPETLQTATDPAQEELNSLLAVDTKHLNVSNEMRRLFGRAAVDSNEEEGEQGGARGRHGRNRGNVGLAAAVNARNGPGAKGLAGLALRRNIFIQGKEEWPGGTSGGLGMEVVDRGQDGSTFFRFVHNRAYQDVQQQFESCRESMDPQRMVQLLQFNPYHINTLLQVSEIAKHEGDHTTSGDMLERALFTLGRAVHSKFAAALSQGKARLSTKRPENREFFVSAWRYTSNLCRRGTWRTAFEWSKLLLSVDPEADSYATLCDIDSLALRARQPQFVKSLSANRLMPTSHYPTVQLSLALAHLQLNEGDQSRRVLFSVLNAAPYLFTALYGALEIDHVPPAVWGLSAPTPYLDLLSGYYASMSKDLWSNPEAHSLLIEITNIPTSPVVVPETSPDLPNEPTLPLARKMLLTESQQLISRLPHSLTSRATSATDPLPPDDNQVSYSVDLPGDARIHGAEVLSLEEQQEFRGLRDFFQSLVQRAQPDEPGQAVLAADENVQPAEALRRLHRMQVLMARLGTNDEIMIPPEIGGNEHDSEEEENET